MTRQPIHEFRRGLIKVRIWQRSAKRETGYTLTIVRVFRNGDLWQESSRLTADDIPLARLALDEAYTWLLLRRASDE